jgi:hypothetical protein
MEEINAYNILVGKSEGKRPRGIPMCVYGSIILKWILKEMLCDVMD